MKADMEIMKTLVLSTVHLTQASLDSKAWPQTASSQFGAYFFVPDMEMHVAGSFPADITAVLTFARKLGVDEVKFDCDADMVDELPTYPRR